MVGIYSILKTKCMLFTRYYVTITDMNGKHFPINSSHFLQNRPNFKPETEASTFRRVETKVIGQSLKIHVTT